MEKMKNGCKQPWQKFIADRNDHGDNLLPVLLRPVNSLSLVSLTPAINTKLQIFPRIFVQICNGPKRILSGPGKLIHDKKPELENLVSYSI